MLPLNCSDEEQCTALHCIALDCNALHCTSLHYTALHCIALHCTALHCTTLHCIALQCTALHCTALHCTALHCTALHCTALQPPSITSLLLVLAVVWVVAWVVLSIQTWQYIVCPVEQHCTNNGHCWTPFLGENLRQMFECAIFGLEMGSRSCKPRS